MNSCFKAIIPMISLAGIIFLAACEPAENPFYEEGEVYDFQVEQQDAEGEVVSRDTFRMMPRTGVLPYLFGHKQVKWEHLTDLTYEYRTFNLFDDKDGINLTAPGRVSTFDLDPFQPPLRIWTPYDEQSERTVTTNQYLEEGEVTFAYEEVGETECPTENLHNETCFKITGQNENRIDEVGQHKLESWFHEEKGFVKWIYDLPNEDQRNIFKLIAISREEDH